MRRHGRYWLLAAVWALLALAMPSGSLAIANIEDVTPGQLPDYDSRDAVAPTAAQLSAAGDLGARVTWNRFGTPSSVINFGGFVATGIKAPDAVAAARQWVNANAALFRLPSAAGLTVETAQ